MGAIQNFFVRAKHWQIFLATIALFCMAMAAMVRSIISAPQGQFPTIFPFLTIVELAAILFGFWLWSLGAFLNSAVPLPFRMKLTLFRFSVLCVPVYLPMFGVLFQIQSLTRNAALILISFAVIFPLHLFAMFCQIYSWYFVSKSLALAENPRPSSLGDYLGYFVGLWILPVGVWIIQPRINRLYAASLS